MAARRPGNRVAMGIGLVVGLLLLGWLAPGRSPGAGARSIAATPPPPSPPSVGSASAGSEAGSGPAGSPDALPGPRSAPAAPKLPAPARVDDGAAPSAPDDLEAGDAAPPALDEQQVRALVTRGEAAMDEGDLPGATEAFRRIVEDAPDAPYAPFAAYKLAWCVYNAGDLRGAAVEMERALAWLEAGEAVGADVLAVEADKDLARFRAEIAAAER